ncbi:porin [Photobacterium indicum]|nr:porin [Photobacterium indicum]
MKKTTIAILVSGACMASASAMATTVYKDDTTSLDVGGRVEVRANFSDANKTLGDDNSFENNSRVRLNIGGEHAVNDDLSVLGFTEFEITEDSDYSGDNEVRYMYAGFSSKKMGDLTFGHQDNAVTYLTDWTDKAETFSGSINEYNASTSDRAANVIRYGYATNNLNFQASYNIDSTSTNNEGWNAMLGYDTGFGLNVGAGYSGSEQKINNVGNQRADSNVAIVAAQYQNDMGIDVAMTYQGGKLSAVNSNGGTGLNESDFNAVDAYLGYNFGNSNVNATYNYLSADDSKDFDINNIGVEYAHYMGNFTAFVSYKFALLDDNKNASYVGDNADDEAMIGARYAF